MSETPRKSITELFEEGTAIDRALRRAVREAVLEHKRIGNPIAVWDDGKVVWIPPEEIRVEDLPLDDAPASDDRARGIAPPVDRASTADTTDAAGAAAGKSRTERTGDTTTPE